MVISGESRHGKSCVKSKKPIDELFEIFQFTITEKVEKVECFLPPTFSKQKKLSLSPKNPDLEVTSDSKDFPLGACI